jgi:hypothetical protein
MSQTEQPTASLHHAATPLRRRIAQNSLASSLFLDFSSATILL